jgi:centromeric protein E
MADDRSLRHCRHGNSIYQQIFPATATQATRKSRSGSDKNSGGSSNGRSRDASPSSSSASGESSAHSLPSSYSFDYLYGPTAPTSQLYDDAVRDSIVAAVDGYHSSVFVYGQTGTGKTHTMLGSRTEPGLIQLAVEDIFDHIAHHAESEFLLRFSYLEIYNEKVYDLLAGGARTDIKIYEVARKGGDADRDVYVCNDVIIKGLTEEILVSVDHVLSLVEAGNFHRHMASTEANDQSSRSHTIFRLVIESQTKTLDGDAGETSVLRSATLNLIDLAGSESVRLANTTGQALEEGRYINRSLLTLGHIIWKLSRASSRSSSSEAQPQHLPYRNSKLTRILQPALGGKAQITIVCTVAPSVECLAETHNTLKFATRARRVKSRLAINQSTGESALLKKYRNRIRVLQDEWDDLELHKLNGTLGVDAVAAIDARQVELQFAIENINRVILNSSHRQLVADAGASGDGNNEQEDNGRDGDGGEDGEDGDEDGDNEEEDGGDTEDEMERINGGADSGEGKPFRPLLTPPSSLHGRSPALFTRHSSSSSFEPESEGSVASSSAALRRNLSWFSDDSARSLQSPPPSRGRSSLMTVLKAKYVAELQRLESSSSDGTTVTMASSPTNDANERDSPTPAATQATPAPTDSANPTNPTIPTNPTTASPPSLLLTRPSSQRELLREFVGGIEIAEAENETRMSQIRELELENEYLRELLKERDAELLALRR